MSVIWLDLEQARLFHFSDERMERETLAASSWDPRLTYDRLAGSLAKSHRILILGPGRAKMKLLEHLSTGFPRIAERIVGCEAAEQSTDQEIAEYATRYFRKAPA